MKGCPMIKQNEGITDRIIRIAVGIIVIFAGLFWFTGIMQIIALIIGAISLVTGITGFCGLYAILGISTKSKKNS
jgi:hypothetical protein